jgi:polygalacturonase
MKLWIVMVVAVFGGSALAQPVFNIKDYGASGRKTDNARPALQQAIDACGKAGGGTVYVPPGEYTSGQLHLRSGVRLYVEAGATIFASLNSREFDSEKTAALFYGEDLHNIALEGRGTLDGQASYEFRPNNFTDFYIMPNQRLMEATGKPLMRSFPVGMGTEIYPRLVLLLRCEDVRISGLKFLRSRSWTINPYACKRLVIDGVYIYSSQKEAVWADGIDPDGCQDVRISNSTVETGDDALVFYSADIWGPALPTENVTVTNCRLSSASSAIKFCDGNSNAVRRVAINNVVITNSNRGLAFMVFDGGIVEDVVISDVLIETRRFDWFWWGDGDPIHFNIKRRSEVDGTKRENEPKAGIIRNVSISNVIAHGTGTSAINGHPNSWLDGIHLDNIHLFVSHDPKAPYENTREAMTLRDARNFSMRDVVIRWEKPESATWQTGLRVENVQNLLLDGLDLAAVPGFPRERAGVERRGWYDVAQFSRGLGSRGGAALTENPVGGYGIGNHVGGGGSTGRCCAVANSQVGDLRYGSANATTESPILLFILPWPPAQITMYCLPFHS